MQAAPLHHTDDELASRVAAHDAAAFEVLMRRHNQRLFRVARAILRHDFAYTCTFHPTMKGTLRVN